MRILLDECVPRPFRSQLADHEVHTVGEMGWAGKKNGVLLQLLSGRNFDALITVDQNLRHQQHLAQVGIGVIVLVAVSNRLNDLIPLVPATVTALNDIQPGQVVEISG